MRDKMDFDKVSEALSLTPIEEVNFAFIKTLQNIHGDHNLLKDAEKKIHHMLKQRLDALQPIDSSQLTQELPRIKADDINHDSFQKLLSRDVFVPFIIEGYLNHTDAVKNWDINHLVSRYHDSSVIYTITNAAYETGEVCKDSLGNVIDMMRNMPDDKFVYIHNTNQIFKDNPNLLDEITFTRLQELYKPLAKCIVQHLFLGIKGSGVIMHCANEINAFHMIYGSKEWTFIDPHFSAAAKGMLGYNASNGFFEPCDDGLYDCVPKYKSTIKAGDLLCFGPWWWHSVNNTSDESIAVATRWVPIKRNVFARGNPLFQDIQQSNPHYQAISNQFLDNMLKGVTVDDDFLHGSYEITYNPPQKKDDEV